MKNKLLRYTKDTPLSRKLLACFVAITLILTLSLGGLCYYFAAQLLLDKTIEQTEETIGQMSDNIEHNVRLINESLSYLAYNARVQEILNTDFSGDERELSELRREMSKMMVLVYYSATLRDLEISSVNGEAFYISSENERPAYDNEALFSLAAEQMGRNTFINNPGSNTVQIVKEIRDLTSLETLGYMRASLKKEALERIMREVDFATEGTILVLDRYKQPVLGAAEAIVENADALLARYSGSFNYKMDGQEYVIVYQHSGYTGWATVAMVPMAVLQRELEPLRNTIVAVALVMLVLSLFLSRLFTHSLATPIAEVVGALDDFGKGDLERRLPEERRDEIGQLQQGFNRMGSEINSLIDQVYRGQILQQESEFKALQAQINPHFLYNTLDTINWMAQKEGMDTVSHMASAVSTLMRASISNTRHFITVAEELEYVQQYLYIQKIRYSEKLFTCIEIDEALHAQVIPKLILQPLVENAVVHGIESSKTGGQVTVSGHLVGEDAVYEVRDTGVGIPAERLRSILENGDMPDDGHHTHLGIRVVHQRIRYLYGAGYGLGITSQPGVGTTVTLRLPYYEDPADFYTEHADKTGWEEKNLC